MSPGPEFGRGRVNSVITPCGVMRPILLALNSENQMLPSGPAASARGPLSGVGIGNSVMTPCGVMRPILPPANSPNQMLPSAPSAIARGMLFGRRDWELGDRAVRSDAADAIAGMLGEPHVAVRAERDDPRRAAGIRQLEFLSPVPSGAIRPIRLPALSVNQSVPSCAMAMVVGPLPGFGNGNSVNMPSVCRLLSAAVSHRC